MNPSKFALWRACVSFCFADAHLSIKEKTWIEEKIALLKLGPEQKIQLTEDLKRAPSFKSLIQQITDPKDRGLLVNYLRQIAALDGTVTAAEKALIESLKNELMTSVESTALYQVLSAAKVSEKVVVHKRLDPLSDLIEKIADSLEVI